MSSLGSKIVAPLVRLLSGPLLLRSSATTRSSIMMHTSQGTTAPCLVACATHENRSPARLRRVSRERLSHGTPSTGGLLRPPVSRGPSQTCLDRVSRERLPDRMPSRDNKPVVTRRGDSCVHQIRCAAVGIAPSARLTATATNTRAAGEHAARL